MRVGLGTGTTVAELVPGARAARGLAITCVATSPATEELARAHGLDVRPFTDIDRLDLAIDGADQVDPAGLAGQGRRGSADPRAHRGRRGRPLRRHRVVGQAGRAPARAGAARVARVRPGRHAARACPAPSCGTPRRTPDGGVLADYHGEVGDPALLSERLDAVPGLVSHGLFPPSMVCDGPRRPRRRGRGAADLLNAPAGSRASPRRPEDDGQRRWASGTRRPGCTDRRRCGRSSRSAEAVEDAVEQHPGLEPGQVHAEAHVRPVGEGDVRLRRAEDVEGRPGRPSASRRGWPSRCAW